MFRAALADRLCEVGNAPVVATATHQRGKLVRSALGSPDTAYGQVFDETPATAIRARLERRLRDVGLVPTSVDVFTLLSPPRWSARSRPTRGHS